MSGRLVPLEVHLSAVQDRGDLRRRIAVAATASLLLALLLLGWSGSSTRSTAGQSLSEKQQAISAIAQQHLGQVSTPMRTSKLGLEDDGGDNAVAVAAAVKDAVGERSSEGSNLADEDYGTPDDLAAVEAVQEAVKAGADAEVDDAVAASKTAAVNDYVAAKADFMAKESAEPNGGVGSIIAMEGEPGHPANYVRSAGHKVGVQQRLAHSVPRPALTRTKLVARPIPAESLEVRIPAGLKAGQKFLADVPAGGQMLVTVPEGASGGQAVVIHAPVRRRAGGATVKAVRKADSGEALRQGVLAAEWHQVAHPEDGLTGAETKLIKEAEHEIVLARDRRAKARQTDSNASYLSTDREHLLAKLDTMALSYQDEEAKARKDDDNDAVKLDAEYRADIDDLLRRIGRDQAPWSFPSSDDSSVHKGWSGGQTGGKGSSESWQERMRNAMDGSKQGTEQAESGIQRKTSLTDDISTDCGFVRGLKIGSVRVFKGIPYGMAPVGDLRWASPVARNHKASNGVMWGCWPGTFLATDFGNVCPQVRASPCIETIALCSKIEP